MLPLWRVTRPTRPVVGLPHVDPVPEGWPALLLVAGSGCPACARRCQPSDLNALVARQWPPPWTPTSAKEVIHTVSAFSVPHNAPSVRGRHACTTAPATDYAKYKYASRNPAANLALGLPSRCCIPSNQNPRTLLPNIHPTSPLCHLTGHRQALHLPSKAKSVHGHNPHHPLPPARPSSFSRRHIPDQPCAPLRFHPSFDSHIPLSS